MRSPTARHVTLGFHVSLQGSCLRRPDRAGVWGRGRLEEGSLGAVLCMEVFRFHELARSLETWGQEVGQEGELAAEKRNPGARSSYKQ